LFQTIGYDPLLSAEVAAEFGVRFKELSGIWEMADYITLHVPLVPQTASNYIFLPMCELIQLFVIFEEKNSTSHCFI
jgi:hypothetical protein